MQLLKCVLRQELNPHMRANMGFLSTLDKGIRHHGLFVRQRFYLERNHLFSWTIQRFDWTMDGQHSPLKICKFRIVYLTYLCFKIFYLRKFSTILIGSPGKQAKATCRVALVLNPLIVFFIPINYKNIWNVPKNHFYHAIFLSVFLDCHTHEQKVVESSFWCQNMCISNVENWSNFGFSSFTASGSKCRKKHIIWIILLKF